MNNALHFIRSLYMMAGVFILSGCMANNEKSTLDKLCDSDTNGICEKLPLEEKLCSKERFELINLQLVNAQRNTADFSLEELKQERDLLKGHKACLYNEYRNLPIFQSTYRGKLKREKAIIIKEVTAMEEKLKEKRLKDVDVSGVYLSRVSHSAVFGFHLA